jgi:hypothetical protein
MYYIGFIKAFELPAKRCPYSKYLYEEIDQMNPKNKDPSKLGT